MSTSLLQARKNLNKSEFEIYRLSEGRNLKALTETQIKSKLKRVQLLKQKYKDLIQRARSKAKRTDVGNEKIKEKRLKIELLSEALGRLKARLATKREAATTAEKKRSPATTKKSTKSAVSSVGTKKRLRKKAASISATASTQKSAVKRKSNQFKKSGKMRIQGHTKAAGQRRQARRDSK